MKIYRTLRTLTEYLPTYYKKPTKRGLRKIERLVARVLADDTILEIVKKNARSQVERARIVFESA